MNEERIRVRLPRLLKKEIESGGALKEAGRLRPLRLELELNMAPLSTAKMTLAENDLPVAMHDLIELYNQHGSAGVYRVTNIQTTYRREREIELKHAIDILHDTVYPGDPAGDEEFDGTVAAFLAKMFTVQSQKMNNVPFWQLGTCEDTGHWNRKIAYDNLYDLITEVSREHEDYLFTFDFSTFPWTVNFVEKNNEVLSEFRLRRNMSSCEVSLDDADLCTRLYLSVTTEEPDNGQSGTSTGKKTTETFATYDDAYSQAIWGVVEKSAGIKASDYPDTAAWVEDYFRRHATPTVQITIDGVELSELTGESIDEMHLGRICRVALPEYGTTFLERIVSVSYPDVLRTPTRVTVSLANKRETAEDSIAGVTKQAESAAAAGRGMAGQIADVEEEAQQQYQTWQTKTDKLIGDYAKITGVKLDSEGNVVYEDEEQTIPVFDPTSPYSLYAKHEVTAQNIVNYVGLTGIQFDTKGNPIYKQAKDAQGNPIWKTDEQENYVLDDEGNKIPVPATDSQGNPIPDLDAGDGHSMYSQISQSLDEINIKVQGKASSAEVRTLADKVGMFITANGDIDAAAIFIALNGDGSTNAYIKADKIQLDGTAVISAIEGAKAPDGQTRLKISADSLDFGGFAVYRTQIASDENAYNMVAHNITTTGEILTKKFTFETLFDGDNESPIVSAKLRTGYDSNSTMTEKENGTLRLYRRGSVNASGQISGPSNVDLYATDFPHYHTVTFDNATGQITIGGITATAPAPFDLTRTTWYQNQISAAEVTGRESVTVSSFTWNQIHVSDNPNKPHGKYYSISGSIQLGYQTGVDGQDNPVYTNIGYPIGTGPQEITGVYNDGWNAGNLAVTLYDSGWANGQRTIGTSGRISASGQPAEIRETIDLAGGVIGAYDSTENKLSFNIYDGTGDNSVDTGADVVATVVPGTVTVTQGTYNAVTHLLPITASALPTVGTAAIPISGSLDVPISGQWKFGSDGTGSTASENAMFGVYSGTTKLFGSSVTLVPSSGLVQLKEGSNVLAKISVSTPTPTYLDQWLYGTGGNDEEANTGAFYRVYANDYQHPVKGTQVQLTHSQAGTTRLVDYANTTKVLAKIDNPKVSGIVTSGYQKIILAASDTGANVSKEVRVTYTDGLGEDRNIIIDASAVYEAGRGSTALTGPTWNDYSGNTLPANRTATYKSGDITAATLRLYLTTESTWTNHIKPVYLNPGSASANAVARIDIDASDEYSAGQRSVVIDTATLSNVVYNSSARSARATLTVSLSNGATKSFSNVDVSTPYQAGLDGGSAVNTQNFTIRLTDNSGFSMDKTKAVNTHDIYQQGVDDASTTPDPSADYAYDGKIDTSKHGNGGSVNLRASSSTSSARLTTIPNNAIIRTKVDLGTTPNQSTAYYSAEWVEVYYDGFSGYVQAQYVLNTLKYWEGGSTSSDYIIGAYSSASNTTGRNIVVYYTFSNSQSDQFTLKASQAAVINNPSTTTNYESSSNQIREVYSDDYYVVGKTVTLVWNSGSTRSFTVVGD